MIGGDRVRDMHLKQQYTGADPCQQDANSLGPQTPKSHTDNVHTPNNRSNNTTGAPAQPSLRYYQRNSTMVMVVLPFTASRQQLVISNINAEQSISKLKTDSEFYSFLLSME